MSDLDEVCACSEEHYRTSRSDGRCDQPPLWMDDPEDETLRTYTACGCCMADCPDVHAEQTMRPVGKATMAAEYVARLPAAEREQLQAKAAAGELTIRPRSEMMALDPDDIRILPSARKVHSWDKTN
ncbi:MAG: hypothetical protein K0U84_20030 [Actinomycetia bacterium]|nr:hypothetical protein [Actinomycetes bacterium]